MLARLKWLIFGPDDGGSLEEQNLRERVAELEAAARLDAEKIEKLEAQLKLRDLAIQELGLFHAASRARLESWIAIDQAKAIKAEKPQQ